MSAVSTLRGGQSTTLRSIGLRAGPVLLVLALTGLPAAGHADATVPAKAEQKCIVEINKQFAKVAKAQGKDGVNCVKNFGKGKADKLGSPATPEDCLTNDVKGKVTKAVGKLPAKLVDRCTEGAPFGETDPNAVVALALAKELGLIHDIFGSSLNAPGILVVADKAQAGSKERAKCQAEALKAAQKCQVAKLKAFQRCKKDGMKGKLSAAIDSAADLESVCLDSLDVASTGGIAWGGIPDPKGKIAKVCETKLTDKLQKKCSADLDALPGCNDPNAPASAGELAGCLDRLVECRVCLALNALDGLNRLCDHFDDGIVNGSCGEPLALDADCEVLNAASCLLPYPSSHFQVAADTPTGLQLELPQKGFPEVNGPETSPAPLNELDGYSPTVQILMHFPQGVDPELSNAARLLPPECCGQPLGPPWVDTRTYDGRSLEPNSPTVLLHADTGARVLHYIEVDARAEDPNGVPDLERQMLILRPGRSLTPGERYIVALRNLRDRDGNPVEPELPFRALRDGLPSTLPAIEDRRAYMESSIFPQLTSASIERSELVLAFDFVVQSEHQLTHQMLSMRDQAYADLAIVDADPNAIPFSVDPNSVLTFDCEDPNDAGGSVVWRRVDGTFESPLFLTAEPGPANAPEHLTDANDTPVQNGFTNPSFSISIPCSVLADPNDPNSPVSRPIVLGHGLFGTGQSMMGIPLGAAQVTDDWTYIAGATDWRGLSSQDFVWVGTQILGVGDSQLNNFPAFPDRLRQGMLNTLVLARMMKLGLFNRDAAFERPGGLGVFPGASEEMYYYGISLGGIMGTWLSALTPDIERFHVDVPAINFACLLQRSTQFDTFELILVLIGLTDPLDTLLGTTLLHELWVSAEPAGYATHITSDPLPGSGAPSRILMTAAWLDKQVSNQCVEIAARTLGLPNLEGSLQSGLQGIPDAASPQDSAYVMYDTGAFDILNPLHDPFIPLLANVIPSGVCDPHGRRPSIPAGILQLVEFLQPDGQVVNFCTGLCDATEPLEIPPNLCDPLD